MDNKVLERLDSLKEKYNRDYGVKGMKWGHHKAQTEEPSGNKSTRNKSEGTGGHNAKATENLNSKLGECVGKNNKLSKSGAMGCLSSMKADMKPGDSISFNHYQSKLVATENDNGTFDHHLEFKSAEFPYTLTEDGMWLDGSNKRDDTFVAYELTKSYDDVVYQTKNTRKKSQDTLNEMNIKVNSK